MSKPKKPVARNQVKQKNMRAHTLENKIAILTKIVSDCPKDISADIALSQAKYNLSIGQY